MHKSVLLKEVINALDPKEGEVFIDATFGAGGYSREILQKQNCKVIAFDRDYNVKKIAKNFEIEFKDNFQFINSPFSEMENIIDKKVDGIVFDLGVSSMQLDEKNRGFSFNSDVKLDMRMDNSSGISAYEVINEFSEEELAKIIFEFGEERKSRQIAKKIILARSKKNIITGLDLVEIIAEVYPYKIGKTNPATKTFQAIRIFVNDELGELKKVLIAVKNLLKTGGRLVVVSFHSLEDSLVKSFMRKESGYNNRNFSRYDPKSILVDQMQDYCFSMPTQSAIKPSKEELHDNVRSRSARLRLAIKN